MAWKVAVVLDEVYSTRDLGMLVHQMPVWAVTTVERQTAATSIRKSAGDLWAPEPTLTLFSPGSATDKEETCLDVLGTVLEHHPGTALLDLIGISASEKLSESLQTAGFQPAESQSHEGLPFRKPISTLENVKDLTLDAQNWRTADDLYVSFCEAVGAPAWHGRNFDALRDSIVTGKINQIEVPYRIHIQNYARMSRAARHLADPVINLIQRFERGGCPVSVLVDQ